MWLTKSLIGAGIGLLLASNAFAITPFRFCLNSKIAKNNSLTVWKTYLDKKPNDFMANFCYGVMYSTQQHPYVNQQIYVQQQSYPLEFYFKALKETNSPFHLALAYYQIANYYATNNGYTPTQETIAKTNYYYKKGFNYALKSNDKGLIQGYIADMINYCDPLEMEHYLYFAQKYFTSEKDKVFLYSTFSNRFQSLKDYQKALYCDIQNLNAQINLKLYDNIINGLYYQIKYDILKANNEYLTQQAVNTFIKLIEYLQANKDKTTVTACGNTASCKVTYGVLAGNGYNDLGDLLYSVHYYHRALLNYKAAYAMYMQQKSYHLAKQELIKIQNTQKALNYNKAGG